jgi:FkbM family methyltransferase
MFKPISLPGKLFRKYILMFSHPAKIRIQNFIGKHLFQDGTQLQNDDGVVFTLDANDWITRIMLMDGNYENSSTALAKKLLANGGVFIDIGANFGLFTCIAAHGNEKVKVIAIEPNYKMIPTLIHNLQSNFLEQRVNVKQAAIGPKIEWVTLEQPTTDNAGTTQTRAGEDGLLSILSCPLEYIVNSAGLKNIQLIKIDIEGNEFEVLKDFPFEKFHVQNIIMEFNHLSRLSFKELQSFFSEKGFESFSVSGKILSTDREEIEENNIWFKNITGL